MFVAFVVVITIVISNMLIGLAVDDIQGVAEKAILTRQQLTIQLALESWYKVPNKYRHRRMEEGRDTGHILTVGDEENNASKLMTWFEPETYISVDKVLQ